MFEFSVSIPVKFMLHKKGGGNRLGKVAAQLRLTLIVKELKINVEEGRVVTTLNIIKH